MTVAAESVGVSKFTINRCPVPSNSADDSTGTGAVLAVATRLTAREGAMLYSEALDPDTSIEAKYDPIVP